MSGFTIKNLMSSPLVVDGYAVDPRGILDLLTVSTVAQIVPSLTNGEIYSKIMGRLIAVPFASDFNNLGLTQSQLNYFAACGFMRGGQDYAPLNPQFTAISGGSVGTTTPANISSRSTGPNSQALDVYDLAPTAAPGNYSTLKGDATAAWASTTTITFNGPTITSSQLRSVYVLFDNYTKPYIWEQGSNAVLSISGTTITVFAIDGYTVPLPASASAVAVNWVAQDKGFDSGLQAARVAPMYGPNSMYDIPFQIRNVANETKSDTVIYYPSSTGIDMSGYADIAFDVSAVSGASTSPLYIWIEAGDDNTFPSATALPSTSPCNISYNCAVVNSAIPLGNQYLTTTNGTTLIARWQVENINFQFVRLCFLNPAANANNSGAVVAYARRKYQ